MGAQAPKVIYCGSSFLHIATWMDRRLIGMVADWAQKNPNRVPGEAEVEAWYFALANLPRDTRNVIMLGVIPVGVSWQFEAAFDGATLHETFHGLYSRKAVLTRQDIRDLVVKNWALIPSWARFANFILDAQNLVEDVRIERIGMEDYPGSVGPLEALTEFVATSPARETKGTDLKAAPQSRGSQLVRRLFLALSYLGHTISTPGCVSTLEEIRREDPVLMQEIEEGRYRPALDALRSIDLRDDLAAMRQAIALAHLVAEEDCGDEVEAPAPGCPACGAGPEHMRGLLLRRPDKSNPVRTMVVVCQACGHSFTVEVTPRAAEPAGLPGSRPRMQVLDLENLPEDSADPKAGLGTHAQNAAAGTYPSIETSMETAASKAWGDQIADAALREKTEAPYNPYEPGADCVVVIPIKEGQVDRALKMKMEVDAEICALRSGLRRLVRSVQNTRVVESDSGIDLAEDHLADTIGSLRARRYPSRAFCIETERPKPEAAGVVLIDESTSMKSWAHEAGKLMLALSSSLEDAKFASACLGFQDGAGTKAPKLKAQEAERYHRIGETVNIHVFKFFHERVGRVLTRFPQVQASGTTPMADGIQAAIEAILTRRERLRMVFVISDGDPNEGTEPVIRRQIRIASQQGIYFCGVGIGPDAQKILDLIPNSVHAETISEVPRLLLTRIANLTKEGIRADA